ncbi:DUF805 domain-containing protein [Noviherbaspirillum cavernae]|uniref:DUF805 domain-containing protein n=1 Tax=Noviherbaspirillum cavernae TaxID=2320862 RepID=A0A418X6V9_9BURK|nr:DUF805 domain-containing protein [Noviherbaspirillum cavernae]RJG08179.1 DUF805 domain-containing protein [Noviherbaspirillum cavernae]
MTFVESIKTCFSKYATFSGRASLSEFWWFFLFLVIGSIVTSVIHEKLSWVFTLATLLPSFAVGARRLHDTDRSGWLQLIGIIPLIGFLILLYFYAQASKSPNRFDAVTVP